MEMASTYKLSFTTNAPTDAETALEAFGASVWATQETDSGTLFEVYLEADPLMAALSLPPDCAPRVEQLPATDWVSASQEGLAPIIMPPFHVHGRHDAPRAGGWLNVEMQAATAFGSGHHGTTQGCLALFRDYMKRHRPRHIADIGCGSGILSIAAAKAGCRHIIASDIDAVAVKVTRRNARLNGVAPHIKAFPAQGMAHRLYHKRRFDLILANILAIPLYELAADFERHLAPSGRLIIAGLLNEQARRVIARYRAFNLIVEQKITIGAWTSLCFKR